MEEIISGKRKWWAVLSYLGILVLFPITKKQNDDFIIYHAKQGVVLIFFFILVDVVVRIAIQQKSGVIGGVVYGVGLLYTLYGIINCIRAKKNPLPLIGKIAEKITL